MTSRELYHTQKTNEPKRTWEDIALELSKEQNSERVLALARELNDAMLAEERAKTEHKHQDWSNEGRRNQSTDQEASH